MNVGDHIICHDAEEAVNIMTYLANAGIETDFDFDYVQKPRIALVVLKKEIQR